MDGPSVIELRFSGSFSLKRSAQVAGASAFVDGPDAEPLVLAFGLDGDWRPVAVRIDQVAFNISATVLANPADAPPELIRNQLERVLSLTTDGSGFEAVGQRDPVIAAQQRRRPGLRPVLFPSPYDAAARAIIGHRIPVGRAADLARRISLQHGPSLPVGERLVHVFPAPRRLSELGPVQGLSERKVEQLRGLGSAAASGWLDADRLNAMGLDAAMAHLQQLAGIGPFSAELILIRGVGDPDIFPNTEMRLQRAMAAAYDLGPAPDRMTLERIADVWRPYRSWAGFLLRNADRS